MVVSAAIFSRVYISLSLLMHGYYTFASQSERRLSFSSSFFLFQHMVMNSDAYQSKQNRTWHELVIFLFSCYSRSGERVSSCCFIE